MSSYLSIYGIPKKERDPNQKPMCIAYFSSSNPIYTAFWENNKVVYSSNDETYTDLTVEDIEDILDDLEEQLKKHKSYYEAFKQYGQKEENYIGEILNWEETIRDAEFIIAQIELIKLIIEQVEINSCFEKFVCSAC